MIDPSIALQVRPPQYADPMEQAGKALNLLAMRRQIQMAPIQMQAAQEQLKGQQLANQQAQTAINEEQAFKDAVARGAKPAELLQVAPKLAVPHFKQLLDQDKARLEQAKQQAGMLSNALGSVVYAPDEEKAARYTAVRADAINRGIIKPEDAPEQYDPAYVDQHFRAAIDADKQIDNHAKEIDRAQRVIEAAPKTANEWMGIVAREGSAAKSQQELDQTRSTLEALGVPKALLASTLPTTWTPEAMTVLAKRGMAPEKRPEFDINSYKAQMGMMGNGEFDQFLAQHARSLGKTPAQLTPEEFMGGMQKFAEVKQDPQMRAAVLAQRNLADVMRKIQLDQMPTKEDAVRLADDIQNHRLSPSQLSEIRGRGNGALGLMIQRELPRGFSWEQADAEYNLAKSPSFQNTVRYMDSVQESIPMVIDRARKLANGSVKSINALVNAGKNQINDVDLKKFNTDRLLVADEIAKILQGGGSGSGTSDAKLKQAGEILSSTDNPAAIAAALSDVNELIGFRRKSLTRGTYLENAAPEKPTGGGKVIVKAGDGSLHPFDNEAQAQAFEQAVKKAGGSTTRQ